MKNKYFTYLILLLAIAALYFLPSKFANYNLNKTISACVVAQKQTNEAFDIEKAKKFCEKEIKKLKKK